MTMTALHIAGRSPMFDTGEPWFGTVFGIWLCCKLAAVLWVSTARAYATPTSPLRRLAAGPGLSRRHGGGMPLH